MSHVSIAAIIVLAIIVIISTLVIMHNHQLKARATSILSFFKKVALVHNFSFTGQEVLREMVIGLDAPRKKLLVVEEKDKNYDTQIIDLSEVNTCKIKKVYSGINSGEYRRNKPEDYLKSMALEFDFNTGKAPVVVIFYKNEKNSIYEIPELDRRVRNWEVMLSKLIKPRHHDAKAQ